MIKATLLIMLATIFGAAGCGRVVGVAASPTASEKGVAAEYPIPRKSDDKILILVNQPAWAGNCTNLRMPVTQSVAGLLEQRVKVAPERIIPYRDLAEFRSQRGDFYSLSAAEVGQALEAELVLVVDIKECRLYELPVSDYYKTSLIAESKLVEVSGGAKVWPAEKEARQVKLNFEAQSGDVQVVAGKLSDTLAHCVVRYFYDCPSNEFRIWGEEPDMRWQEQEW